MKSGRSYAGLDEHRLPCPVIDSRVNGRTVRLTEHQVSVAPFAASSEPFGVLIGAMRLEIIDQSRRDRDRPPAGAGPRLHQDKTDLVAAATRAGRASLRLRDRPRPIASRQRARRGAILPVRPAIVGVGTVNPDAVVLVLGCGIDPDRLGLRRRTTALDITSTAHHQLPKTVVIERGGQRLAGWHFARASACAAGPGRVHSAS
jgi:hypothetical protein